MDDYFSLDKTKGFVKEDEPINELECLEELEQLVNSCKLLTPSEEECIESHTSEEDDNKEKEQENKEDFNENKEDIEESEQEKEEESEQEEDEESEQEDTEESEQEEDEESEQEEDDESEKEEEENEQENKEDSEENIQDDDDDDDDDNDDDESDNSDDESEQEGDDESEQEENDESEKEPVNEKSDSKLDTLLNEKMPNAIKYKYNKAKHFESWLMTFTDIDKQGEHSEFVMEEKMLGELKEKLSMYKNPTVENFKSCVDLISNGTYPVAKNLKSLIKALGYSVPVITSDQLMVILEYVKENEEKNNQIVNFLPKNNFNIIYRTCIQELNLPICLELETEKKTQ
jgi:hypothetical protein